MSYESSYTSMVYAKGLDWWANIHLNGWKEHLKICKVAKFECALLKTNEDIAPKSRIIKQTKVW